MITSKVYYICSTVTRFGSYTAVLALAVMVFSCVKIQTVKPEAVDEPEASPTMVAPQDLAPVDVKFTHLLNAELGKSYIGKRVRTQAGYYMLSPSMMGQAEKYKQGWLAAVLFAATTKDGIIECDMVKVFYGVLAPTEIGSVWADAKQGTVYEVVGIVHATTHTSGITGSIAAGLNLEVEELKAIGQCPEEPGLSGAK